MPDKPPQQPVSHSVASGHSEFSHSEGEESQRFLVNQGSQESPPLKVHCGAAIGSIHLSVDLSLRAQWTVLFGPSGSGKSSLLRLAAGLWRPVNSHILLFGDDVTDQPPHLRRRGNDGSVRLAMVTQTSALFPHLTLLENVCFGLPSHLAAEKVLEELGLSGLESRYPRGLSGGEQRRAALAQALAPAPRLLLLDETFTGLETPLRHRLISTLKKQQSDTGIQILSVTHDVAEAMLCADEVIRMEEGRITARGLPTEVLQRERNTLLRDLSADA